MDHELLLVLANGPGKGLKLREILDSKEPQSHDLDRLRSPGYRNPVGTLRSIVVRLSLKAPDRSALVEAHAKRWSLIPPGMDVEGHLPGAQSLAAEFLRCREIGCSRDHFPDLVYSDYWFQVSRGGAYRFPLERLVAKVIVHQTARDPAIREQILERQRSGEGGLSLGDLMPWLKEDTLEDRVIHTYEWIHADAPRLHLFIPRSRMREEPLWAGVASPTFWRKSFDFEPLKDADFVHIPSTGPLDYPTGTEPAKVDRVRPRDVEGPRSHHGTLSLALLALWLRWDVTNFARATIRLRACGGLVRMRQDDDKITLKVTLRGGKA